MKKITKERFNAIMRELREVGYNCMSKDDQKILDAWDRGENIFGPNPKMPYRFSMDEWNMRKKD